MNLSDWFEPSDREVGAVIFDAVGTLLHPNTAVADIYARIAGKWGNPRTAVELQPRFYRAFQSEEEVDRQSNWRTSEAREIARWKSIVHQTIEPTQNAEHCFHELYDHFGHATAWKPAPQVGSLLRHLAGASKRLGIASNFDVRLLQILQGMEELELVRPPQGICLISSLIGWRKPSPHFFQCLIQAVDLPPQAILFVGDDLHNDYLPAQQAGLRAVLVDPRDRFPNVPRRIRDLTELFCW